MFVECKFPELWKNALVIPIPKNDDPKQISDLRPISILPCLSKVAEKLIDIQVRRYLELNDILPITQSGFRAGYSCTTALTHIVDDITQAVDEGKSTAMVLLDYSKAFDTINYQVLLSILQSSGFDTKATLLLSSYLKNRSQVVRINDKLSEPRILTSGVPQGSILGPTLFSIYTSQFVKRVKYCSIHMYADDTQLYYSFDKMDHDRANLEINSDLQYICNASSKHSLVLNSSKSAVILFAHKQDFLKLKDLINIKIMGTTLQVTDRAKNLGLILDNSLRFREQVTKLIQRAYCALRLLYPHRSCLDSKTKKMLCESLVLSQFNYCAPVYGPCLDQTTSNRIQRVQNSCIRFIYGIRKFEHVSHKLKDLRWLNMLNRRHFLSLCMFHNIIVTKTPPYLFKRISFRTDVHNLNIRSQGLLTPPKHKTAFFERGFKYTIYNLYNKVSCVVQFFNIFKFKLFIHKQLLSTQNE